MTASSRPTPQETCEVLIVGGGPTGLLLAALLIQRGVDVLVLERRDAPRQDSRAIEHLEDRAPGLVRRGWEVTNLRDSASHAEVTACSVDTDETAEIRAQVVVGADGAHSTVRNLLRIPTRGRVYPDSYLMGDLADPGVRSDPPGRGAVIHLEAGGVVESFRLPGGRRRSARRLVTTRCVLIGDAVHEVSPIGGQGMTLSWLEALDLAPLLEREARRMHGAAPRALHRDPAWRHLEGRCRRRARTAGALAFVNTALGRPLPEPLDAIRATTVRFALATPARHGLAWAYSMGWVRAGRARSR